MFTYLCPSARHSVVPLLPIGRTLFLKEQQLANIISITDDKVTSQLVKRVDERQS